MPLLEAQGLFHKNLRFSITSLLNVWVRGEVQKHYVGLVYSVMTCHDMLQAFNTLKTSKRPYGFHLTWLIEVSRHKWHCSATYKLKKNKLQQQRQQQHFLGCKYLPSFLPTKSTACGHAMPLPASHPLHCAQPPKNAHIRLSSFQSHLGFAPLQSNSKHVGQDSGLANQRVLSQMPEKQQL